MELSKIVVFFLILLAVRMNRDEENLCCGKRRVVYNNQIDLNQRVHSGVIRP